MKFANKLFFATTAVLTIIFFILGFWMLSSYFSKTLKREMEQADVESKMFQYLFEMAYYSVAEYGEVYAINSALDSVTESIEGSGNKCFAWSEAEKYYGDVVYEEDKWDALTGLAENLEEENTYACGIRQIDDKYYLLSVCASITGEETVYLGISKDITNVYQDRQELLNQYRLALLMLLGVGGGCIYLLSQYITKPIRMLNLIAGEIARGNYEKRSDYESGDEIGTLAASFNCMADSLMLQMQEKELEAKRKESFSAAFAHELKTPLTSIIGYADMLNSIALSEEERREAYYYIYSQGKRLENLSHKLLELVSLEQESLRMRAIPTNELEENIRVTMRPILQKRKIRGKITLEKGSVYGDKDLLLSVLYNLLDNAVKAVETGGFILLKGRCLEKEYEFKVVDNGRGIPKQEINRITEAFYMVDKSRSRKEGGAGIGMALCQRIITMHNGILRVESQEGEGTVVQLLLPGKEG